MKFAVRLIFAAALAIGSASFARAQEPLPRIGPIVVDLRGLFVRFPSNQQLVDSRGLTSLTELPGTGLGGGVGLHVYPLKWKQVTFGIGGEVVGLRAHNSPPADAASLRPVTEKFLSASPQLSFNFGGPNGWSYISGGAGRSEWSIILDGASSQPADVERLTTYNYGGGGRWFVKRHLAFSFDVRIYSIKAGTPSVGFPGGPRSTLTVIGAGVSLK